MARRRGPRGGRCVPGRIRCIRERRFKYARYVSDTSGRSDEHELYDLREDPHEMVNLAHDPARRAELRARFDALRALEAVEFAGAG